MRLVLPHKNNFVPDVVQEVYDNIENYVTREECDRAIDEAAERIRRSPGYETAAMAWSGGKDSLALEVVCREAGVTRGMISMNGECDFPNFRSWVELTKPDGVEMIDRTEFTYEWLSDHRERLFPHPSDYGRGIGWWITNGTRAQQHTYADRYHPGVMIHGRRRADGNVCGDKHGFMESKKGLQFSPLHDWPHELVLATIRYHWLDGSKELPPVYRDPLGWKESGAPWPGRGAPDEATGWKQTWDIDPLAVLLAVDTGLFPLADECARREGHLV